MSDLNFLFYLLNVNIDDLPQQNPMLWGRVLKNFVAVELSKQITFSGTCTRLYHYRTSSGQEIDFLLEGPQGKIVAIEVKATSKVSAKDFRHLEALKADLGDAFHRGFVIYQDKDIIPYGNNLFAIPLAALW